MRSTLVGMAFLVAISARADDKIAARSHYDTAERLYEVGEYERALAEFKAAYVAKDDPAFLFNIGQCYRKLGQGEQALDYYRRFLKVAAPDDPNRAQVADRLRDTETDAVFKGDIERAEERKEAAAIAWDDPFPATSPPPRPVPPVVVKRPAPVPPKGDQGRYLRIAGIAAGSVGVASIVTAIYFYARARAYSDIVSNHRNHTAADEQSGRNSETAQWVFYGIGAAALATGAVLYWRGCTVAPGPVLAGISIGGPF